MELHKQPVIMWSMSRWDGHLSSASLSIAKELAKTRPVFYLDYPFTFLDLIRERKLDAVKNRSKALFTRRDLYTRISENDSGGSLTAVVPPLMFPFYFLKEHMFFRKVIELNNQRFFNVIRQIIKDFKLEEYILYNSFNPFYGYEVPQNLSPTSFIYQCRDNLRGIDIMKPAVQFEQEAVKNANIAMATSSYLVKVLSAETGTKVHLIPNAAQTDLFKQVHRREFKKPKELEGEERKVVAFIGNIGMRMDFPLLDKVLRDHPDKLFLMIGPQQPHEYKTSDWTNAPNVKFTGPKTLDQLPSYLQHIDCSIIPFVKDELTAGIYPLKLNEHLAAGKPVICTDFSDDVKLFEGLAYVSSSHEEFSILINRAIDEDSTEKIQQRIKSVEGNSWADRIKELYDLIQAQLADKKYEANKS